MADSSRISTKKLAKHGLRLLKHAGLGTLSVLLAIADEVDWGLTYPYRRPWCASSDLLHRRSGSRQRIYQDLWRLERSGMIERRGKGSSGEIRLTAQGQRRIRRLLADDQELSRAKPWDGQWHVVVFDVPEEHRVGRNLLRRKLVKLGCLPLQKSVFLYPYEFRGIIEEIRDAYDLRTDLHYLVANSIDRDAQFIRRFQQRGVLPKSHQNS